MAVSEGAPIFELNPAGRDEDRIVLGGPELPIGAHVIEVVFGPGMPSSLTMTLNGEQVATAVADKFPSPMNPETYVRQAAIDDENDKPHEGCHLRAFLVTQGET